MRLPLVPALLVAAVVLAGCAEDGADDGSATAASSVADQPKLAAGKGAIAGLLVDDRYRPIHLTDNPRGEFDAKGFILLVETGETVASDVNGEFNFLDLAPGFYTLKPAVSGHEGAPHKVLVDAGSYAETDVVVRRVIDPGKDFVVIHDDTVLVTCSVQVLDGQLAFGRTCHGDLSDEESLNYIDYNYTQFPPIAAVVVEFKFNKVGDYETWLTEQVNLIGPMYNESHFYNVDYGRVHMVPGQDDGYNSNTPFDPANLRVWVMTSGPGTQETQEATGIAMGVGFEFVVEVRIVTSAFFEMPKDLGTYAVLS